MSNNQRESLEDRLAKRRRMRNKRFLDKNSVDESEVRLINHSPTTQSLDRKSSKRIIPISSLTSPETSTRLTDQGKTSSTITKNPELPPIDNSYLKQNYRLSGNKTNSTPLLPQITKNQSMESENDKQTSSKSLSTNEEQQHYSPQDEKPVVTEETVSPPATTEKANATHKNFHSPEDEKPVIIKEAVPPPTTTEKFNPIEQETHEKPVIKPAAYIEKSNPVVQETDEKPVIIKETVSPPATTEKSNPIEQETHEKVYAHQDEKPVIIKETPAPIAPPIVPRRTTERPDPIEQETHEKSVIIKETVAPILPPRNIEKPSPILRETRGNSTPYRLKNFPPNLEWDHPSSDPQSSTDREQKTFQYPALQSKPIARTTSEQIVSITKRKHPSIDPNFGKQNSLALPYLFNKRMIDAELNRTTSLDQQESQPKTVWD